jgi:hypothetical protein
MPFIFMSLETADHESMELKLISLQWVPLASLLSCWNVTLIGS